MELNEEKQHEQKGKQNDAHKVVFKLVINYYCISIEMIKYHQSNNENNYYERV